MRVRERAKRGIGSERERERESERERGGNLKGRFQGAFVFES